MSAKAMVVASMVCVAVISAACGSDREPTAPAPAAVTAPGFSLVGTASATDISALIDQLFPAGGLRTAAQAQFSNIQRMLAAGKIADAQTQALALDAFAQQKYANGQLLGGQSPETLAMLESLGDQVTQFAGLVLSVDQSNPPNQHVGVGNGLWGQTFTPTESNVASVDATFILNQVPAGGVSVTLGLYTDITQPPLATTAALVDAAAPGELTRPVTFTFASPVPVTPGTVYTIGIQVPASLSWEFNYGDQYQAGQAVDHDGVAYNPPADFAFNTVTSTAGILTVDQYNLADQGLGIGNGLWGQTFIPTASNLARVDALLTVHHLPAGVSVRLGLYSDITQPPIATTTAFVAAPGFGEVVRTVSFDFLTPAPLIPGNTYTIGIDLPPGLPWRFYPGDMYPRGSGISSAGTLMNADFIFTTYTLK